MSKIKVFAGVGGWVGSEMLFVLSGFWFFKK